jgi:hypothetical protein
MNRTDYKLLGCPEPPDKPRMTDAQKRIKQAVSRWFAKVINKFGGEHTANRKNPLKIR